ncbi:hypothetical protein AVEN_18299-1, partial [Araneus ventricosus]
MQALTILIHKDPIAEEAFIQGEVSGIPGLAHFIRVEITEIIPITEGIVTSRGSCNTDDKDARHNNDHARTQKNIVKRNKSNKKEMIKEKTNNKISKEKGEYKRDSIKQKVSNNTSSKEKDKNKIKENGKINVQEVQNKLDEDVVIMSCNSSNNLNLPIIDSKFSDSCFAALLDTGANVSLIQPSALEKIKEQNKTNWSSKYSIILGYDIIPKNYIALDIPNKKILIQKQSFGFYEDTPRSSSPSLSADTESSQ